MSASHTPADANRPNVVLICTDQWRGDCLGVEHGAIDTPYLDHFASGGCRFRRAYTATASCIPARAALYTGLTQGTHGRVGYQDGVPWRYETTVASAFRDQGYQTHAVGKMHVYPERSRMGFDSIDLHDGYMHFGRDRTRYDLEMIDDYLPWLRRQAGHDADYFDQGTNCNSYTPHPWDKDEMLHPTAWVSTMGADFLRRRDTTKPFFLMLSYHRPHPPLDPPKWAYEQYLHAGLDIPEPLVGDWEDSVFDGEYQPHACLQQPRKWPADKIRRARAAYYGQLTFIDHQVQRFVEILDEYGHLQNTIFCFVSDHGDMIGDHHCYAKSVSYEGSTRIPFLLFSPRSELIPRGVVDNDHVVELRDVMPTLLDAAGLEIPESVEGSSLMPLLRGESIPWRDYLHGEHSYPLGRINSMHYIVTSTWKYVWHSGTGREQLFDLANDPDELHDLAMGQTPQNEPAMLARLRQCLVDELTGRQEGFVRDGRLVAGRPVVRVLSDLQ